MTVPATAPLPQTPIAVAISGGADSLHTLLFLKEQGANLIAVHGLFGQRILARFMEQAGLPVPSPTFEELAGQLRALCETLDIPFHLLDCEAIFLQEVIEPFVRTYREGGTPNPCALCNATVKLGDLLRQCLLLGTTHMATGHYAQCLHSPTGPVLLQGSDPTKDQSYFLALTTAEQLSKLIFPVGARRKKDILAELAARNIQPPQRGESQEICFIPGNMYREFLPFMAAELGLSLPKGGQICLEDGTCLGTHKGLWHYTEGQRRGIGIGWKEPLHVLAKEQEGNILRVGPKEALRTSEFTCETTNILIDPSRWPEIVQVKARYREAPRLARVTFEPSPDNQSAKVGNQAANIDSRTETQAGSQADAQGGHQANKHIGNPSSGATKGQPEKQIRGQTKAQTVSPNGSYAGKPVKNQTMHVRYEDTNTTVSCGQLAVVYIPHEDNKDQLCVAAGGIITSAGP